MFKRIVSIVTVIIFGSTMTLFASPGDLYDLKNNTVYRADDHGDREKFKTDLKSGEFQSEDIYVENFEGLLQKYNALEESDTQVIKDVLTSKGVDMTNPEALRAGIIEYAKEIHQQQEISSNQVETVEIPDDIVSGEQYPEGTAIKASVLSKYNYETRILTLTLESLTDAQGNDSDDEVTLKINDDESQEIANGLLLSLALPTEEVPLGEGQYKLTAINLKTGITVYSGTKKVESELVKYDPSSSSIKLNINLDTEDGTYYYNVNLETDLKETSTYSTDKEGYRYPVIFEVVVGEDTLLSEHIDNNSSSNFKLDRIPLGSQYLLKSEGNILEKGDLESETYIIEDCDEVTIEILQNQLYQGSAEAIIKARREGIPVSLRSNLVIKDKDNNIVYQEKGDFLDIPRTLITKSGEYTAELLDNKGVFHAITEFTFELSGPDAAEITYTPESMVYGDKYEMVPYFLANEFDITENLDTPITIDLLIGDREITIEALHGQPFEIDNTSYGDVKVRIQGVDEDYQSTKAFVNPTYMIKKYEDNYIEDSSLDDEPAKLTVPDIFGGGFTFEDMLKDYDATIKIVLSEGESLLETITLEDYLSKGLPIQIYDYNVIADGDFTINFQKEGEYANFDLILDLDRLGIDITQDPLSDVAGDAFDDSYDSASEFEEETEEWLEDEPEDEEDIDIQFREEEEEDEDNSDVKDLEMGREVISPRDEEDDIAEF